MENYTIEHRALLLGELVQNWLSHQRHSLQTAIKKTIDEKCFSDADIQFALKHLKETVTTTSLLSWVEGKSMPQNHIPKSVLCLHAGNLPLVGFQDVISIVLSGHRYIGKLSKKDPYIIADFINYIREDNRFIVDKFSTELTDLSEIKADVLLFSGSESGAIEVQDRLKEMGVIYQQTKQLIRTAHASVAWFESDLGGWDSLTESIFRYEGRGCRSVAVVFTPNEPKEILDGLYVSAEKFMQRNPPLAPVSEGIKFRFAYNQAVERASMIIGTILIEVGNPTLKKDHVVIISKGRIEDAREFIRQSGSTVQAFYSNNEALEGVEPLTCAQTPAIYWKPDGIDPLDFLLNLD